MEETAVEETAMETALAGETVEETVEEAMAVEEAPMPKILIDPSLVASPLQWTVTEYVNQRAAEYLLSIELADFKKAMEVYGHTDEVRTTQTAIPAKQVDSEFKNLQEWLLRTLGKTDGIARKYQHPIGRKWGRRYAQGGMSLQSTRRILRSVLSREEYDDVDIINSAPTVYDQLADSFDIPHAYLKQYVCQRDELLDSVMQFYSCDRDEAKVKFTVSMYSDKIQQYTHPFLDKYDREMKELQAAFMKRAEYTFIRPYVAKEKNKLGTFFSYVYHFHEGQMLDTVMIYLAEKHPEVEVGVLAYDGFQIKKKAVKADDGTIKLEENPTSLLQEIEQEVSQRLGFLFRFKYKAMDQTMEVPDDFVYNGLPTFDQVCEEFNKTHCKVGYLFVKERGQEKKILTERQIETMYKQRPCLNHGAMSNFISNWLKNNMNMRVFEEMDLYPNDSRCPADVYNLWTPFAYDLIEGEYEVDEEALELILFHMRVLCNHDQQVYDFLLTWLAHAVQHPEIKSAIITLVSKPRAGKGTLVEILKVLLGRKKVLQSSEPKRDVWGDFNGPMKDAYLVNLNEISAKDFYDAYGKYKQLITDGTVMINQKGQDQREMISCHRFLATTNNDDSGPTDEGREVFIRCSDELIGNTDHFNQMRSVIESEGAMRTFWDYLKSYKCPQHIDHTMFPVTSFHKDLKQQNQSNIMHWVEDMVRMAIEKRAEEGDMRLWTYTEKRVPFTYDAHWKDYQSYLEKAKKRCHLDLAKFRRQIKELGEVDGISFPAKPFKMEGKAHRGMILDLEKLKTRFGILGQ